MRRTVHGARTRGGSVAKLTHNTKVFGIMGGLAPMRNVSVSTLRGYREGHAKLQQNIPLDPVRGLNYMRGENPLNKYLLSQNPAGTGGVGTMWSARKKCNCDQPSLIKTLLPVDKCQLPPPKKNQTIIQHINKSNIQLLTQNPPPKNVYYVVTEAVSSNNALFVDPTSTLCISSGGSIDLSQSTYSVMAGQGQLGSSAKLWASDIYNCGTLTLGDISGGNVGIFATTLNLTNNGTLTFKDISGNYGIGAATTLNLTNNGTLTLGDISNVGITAANILNLTNNGTLTLGDISGNYGISAGTTLNLTNNGTLTLGDISGNVGITAGNTLNVIRKGRICVGSISSTGTLSHPPTLTPSCY